MMDQTPIRIPPAPFQLAAFSLAPRFPALRFAAQDEFKTYLVDDQRVLDARFSFENALVPANGELVRAGTCAPCLRPASFTTGPDFWEGEGEERRPYWRETLACDCVDRLPQRARALIHFVQAGGVLPGTRLLLCGTPTRADERLAVLAPAAVQVPKLAEVPPGPFDLAIVQEELQFTPNVWGALPALVARLAPAARLVLTLPFFPTFTRSELIGENFSRVNRFGWDLLTRLREAGCRDAAAYLYWSSELGLLGPMNFIVRAVK
jgi:hypothetical protein